MTFSVRSAVSFLRRASILPGFVFSLFVATVAPAQTNPTAQTLPFSLSAQTGSALPAGVALHRFGTVSTAIPTTRTVTPGNADLPYNATSNAGGWRDESANGIGLLASSSNAAGALVVAINTTGKTGVQVSWRCGTILQQASRDSSVALQYRVGTTGDFINVGTASTYSSAGQTAGTFSNVYTETLPVGAENQPVVQVRWIYWESSVGLTGSRDRIAVDDISISGGSGGITNPEVTGNSASTQPGASVQFTAVVTPGSNPASTGLVVTADISTLGGSASQGFTAGAGNTFSYTHTVPVGQAYGSYSLPVTVTDSQGRSGTGSISLSVGASFTVFHVNDVHSRLQPLDYDVPGIDDVPVFQQVGGAAYMGAKLFALKQAKPNSLVLDAGDISEGGPLGDLGGNRGLISVYQVLDTRLKSLGGRGFDALVVGNHDVRYPEMLTNMRDSGMPFISMNLISLTTGTPFLPEHKIVDLDGVRVGILGYTTDTSSHLGPDTVNMVRVDKCTWDGGTGVISIKQKVAALRAAPNNCDVVILLAHIGHSRIFSGTDQLIKDNDPAVPPPQLAITGHWHSMTDTAWQPSITNHKTTLSEASSYMQHIGEVNLSSTGGYLSAQKHLVDNATITPDAAIQTVIDGLAAEFNASSPLYQLEQVIGYSATDLRLNKNKWWSHNEFPWAGDNAAGAWISDSMQWWVSTHGYACDLALQSGGGVRRDNAAGPITYREIYETYPWRDDNMILVEVKGQEIWNFIQNDFCGTSISQGWKVYANDGLIWKIEKDGMPIDPAATYSVAISSYMYDHANDTVGGAWSDTTPTTVTANGTAYSIRQTVIEYTSQFTQANPMVVPGGRYALDTTHAGRFEAVVTMVDDVEDQPYFESVFVRLLRATPDTVARRGGYASADLVNADSSINPNHQFAESMLYRSYLGFQDGALQPGDKLLVAVEGGFHGGNPQLVEQEGIVADGVEFNRITGSFLADAQPDYKPDIASFWDEHHENHFVKFQGEKVSANRIKDRRGFEIAIHQRGAYNLATLPGNVGDQLELTGVQTYRFSERRFRLASATVVHTAGSVDYTPTSAVSAISPAVQTNPALTLTASASDVTEQTFSKLIATDDTNIQSGNMNATGHLFGATESTRMYLQSSAIAASTYGNERMLTQFNLSTLPVGATITSAKLRLYCFQQTATGAIAADAHLMTSDSWDETTATWNNTASLLGTKLGSTLLYVENDQWYEWDVTATVATENVGDKVVSFMVKPAAEDAATQQQFTFDTKGYQSGAMGPFLEVEYSGVTAGGGTVAQVAFFYRHSADCSAWGPWTSAGTDSDGAPWLMNFNYPAGYGHYQFYSVATDNTANVEPAPLLADASVIYAQTATVTLGNLAQTYDGTPRAPSVTTNPSGLAYSLTYDGSTSTPVGAGTYAVVATVTQPGYIGSSSGTLEVAKAAQTISFAPLASKWVTDAPFALTATASSGLPVAYTSSVPAVAGVSGSIVTVFNAGATVITASQAGDTNYRPAANVAQTQTVNLLVQTIDFPSIASRALSQAPFTPPAGASSGLPVTISVVSGPATVSANSVTLTGTGTVVLRATQAGDSVYAAASSVDQSFTVTGSGAGPAQVPAMPSWALGALAVLLMLAAGLGLKHATGARRE